MRIARRAIVAKWWLAVTARRGRWTRKPLQCAINFSCSVEMRLTFHIGNVCRWMILALNPSKISMDVSWIFISFATFDRRPENVKLPRNGSSTLQGHPNPFPELSIHLLPCIHPRQVAAGGFYPHTWKNQLVAVGFISIHLKPQGTTSNPSKLPLNKKNGTVRLPRVFLR